MIEANLLPKNMVDRNAEDVIRDVLLLPAVERYNLYTLLKDYEMSMLQYAMGLVPLPILEVITMIGAMSYAESRITIEEYYASLHSAATEL